MCPPDAPDAEIGFAQAAVVRPGTALKIDPAALNRAAKQVVGKEARAESAQDDKSTEDRLSDLEDKVKKIDTDLVRLTNAVERLVEISKPAAATR